MTDDKRHLRRKADEILQEFRIVLPGTQALLGFQLIAFFNDVFLGLPHRLQYLHFAAFLLTVFSTIIMVAPVAFQQIGEGGHTTQRFLRFARAMLNSAMLFILLALTCEMFVVSQTIGLATPLAAGFAGAVLLVGVFFWYVYVLVRRTDD